MTDPLNDPRWPDRPDHPDFWRLAEVVMRLDGASTEGGLSMQDLLATVVDLPSVEYMIRTRAEMFVTLLGAPEKLTGLVEASMLTGFMTGVDFQKAGGKQ